MKYIIPSIGRSGSTLITDLIADAAGEQKYVAASYQDIICSENNIIKTHAHFVGEFDFNYKAVFMYSTISTSVKSLYYIKKRLPWIRKHLIHLGVENNHVDSFLRIMRNNKIPFARLVAYCYLLSGDKFKFKKNYDSWRKSEFCLFVRYEDIIAQKDETLEKISGHVDLTLKAFEIKKRKTAYKRLPFVINMLVFLNYRNHDLYVK